MLYSRNYKILLKEEITQRQKAKKYLDKYKASGISPTALFKYHDMMPKAAYYYESLFPNNLLFIGELEDQKRLSRTKTSLKKLLDKSPSERQIIDFIKKNEAYFVIGSIFQGYFDFGHHQAFAFKEFELPPNYIADYLLIGKNSGGYEFVFVELEDANINITTKDGSFGATIRKGLKQVDEWNSWLEANFSHLKLLFDKYVGEEEMMPNEFMAFDKTRVHFVVVAGRRTDYNEKTYRLRRKLNKESNVKLLHYDNLIDGIDSLIQVGNY